MKARWPAQVVRWTLRLGLLALLVYLGTAIYLGTQVKKDTRRQTDAIVVLGARVNHKNGINPCLRARVNHGVRLWEHRYAPLIIMSGGNDIEDGANEADAMFRMARQAGVPETALVREREAHSTYENLLFTRKIMQDRGLKSLLIVTENYHMPRASLIAQELGLDHAVSPVQDSPCWTRWTFLSRYFLREPLALIKNKVLGRW
ncbi:YdcF family protein [Deinococcus cellulosilyticus]|uniref:DUF218 domain-containing protein n=1 Tax=Deinococcus cellulosilyticus (strain DSM 18568 / NBRC 106333 / KACC 11606 / 5516J-15) TaxID=1223518 RepID=A0A511MY14_DEIC1|nr:YdcF family protein [Deinococcus cellulosilyticus]GEM45178.1 hypothetical protein DC3_08130 [Deinococcus cellulosilyticus NBRC 106333 = KACC 11606]